MSILQSLLYGLISGLAEFLPISSQAHQALLNTLFGADTEPFRNLLIHGGMLLAVLTSCGTYIQRLRRDGRSGSRRSRKNPRHSDRRTAYDLHLIKSAALPMVIVMLLSAITGWMQNNLALVALFFVINGILIYIPEHLPQSNKDASQMSALDSFLISLSGLGSVFPGVSRVGLGYSCAIARGGDKEKSLNWILILSIPALCVTMAFDLISIVTSGFGILSFSTVFGCVISAVASFGAACCGIFLMRFMTVRSGVSAFGYYCWGAALLSLILYLTA